MEADYENLGEAQELVNSWLSGHQSAVVNCYLFSISEFVTLLVPKIILLLAGRTMSGFLCVCIDTVHIFLKFILKKYIT